MQWRVHRRRVSLAGSRRQFAAILRQGSGEDPSVNPWLTFDP